MFGPGMANIILPNINVNFFLALLVCFKQIKMFS